MPRAKITVEEKRKALDMIAAGAELHDAAEAIGKSEHTLKDQWKKWAAELGYKFQMKKRCYNRDIPDETKRYIVEMMVHGEAASHLARETKVSETIIYARWREWADQFGIQTPPKKQIKHKTKHVPRTPAEKKEKAEITAKRHAVLMKDQGINTKEVAAATGFSARKIDLYWKQWARELGIEIIQPIRKEPAPTNGEVITYYVDHTGKRVERK